VGLISSVDVPLEGLDWESGRCASLAEIAQYLNGEDLIDCVAGMFCKLHRSKRSGR
jgi:hypothetical protein